MQKKTTTITIAQRGAFTERRTTLSTLVDFSYGVSLTVVNEYCVNEFLLMDMRKISREKDVY